MVQIEGRSRPRRGWLGFAIGAVVLALMILLPAIGIMTTEKDYPADAGLRIAFVHGGEFLPVDLDEIGGEFSPDVTPGAAGRIGQTSGCAQRRRRR